MYDTINFYTSLKHLNFAPILVLILLYLVLARLIYLYHIVKHIAWYEKYIPKTIKINYKCEYLIVIAVFWITTLPLAIVVLTIEELIKKEQ